MSLNLHHLSDEKEEEMIVKIYANNLHILCVQLKKAGVKEPNSGPLMSSQ